MTGREAGLECIGAFVKGVSDGSPALLIEGEAGVGKTTLGDDRSLLSRQRGAARSAVIQ